MTLKDFDDVNPRTRDKNWKEDIPLAQMPKRDEWYTFRVCGGVFSYAQHWIEFVNKQGDTKRYPVDCANWDPEEEATSNKEGGCPACELGLRPGVRYMMNAIDRDAQGGKGDPIRGLDLAPTVMRQLVDLKKLNMVKGNPRSVAHAKFGCDIHLMKQNSKKRGGVEWQVQKGERVALTEEELEYETIDFGDYWLEPDTHKVREDLKRHGYYDDEDDDEDEKVPTIKSKSKKSKKASSKRRKPPVEDDEESEEDDDEDFDAPPRKKKPSRRRAKTPPPEDLDDEDDEDEDDEAPPRRRKQNKAAKKIRRAPPKDDDEDDDDDDEDDEDWDD